MARSGALLVAIGRGIQNARRQREREAAKELREEQRRQRASRRERAAAAQRSAAAQVKEERALYLAQREAEAEEQSADAQSLLDELNSLLAASLAVDDYVDLTTLRETAVHPPFDPGLLSSPKAPPVPSPYPAAPMLDVPSKPGVLGSLFGAKRRHEEAVQAAQLAHEHAKKYWEQQCRKVDDELREQLKRYEAEEVKRLELLSQAEARYKDECAAREMQVLERNKALDTLVNELAYGVADAVQDYVAIVMSNSVYPESFPVEHDFEFDPESAELRLIVKVPHPDRFPTTASFKYVKASDSITPVALTAKELRERYCSAIYQVALRSFHEVFEADRRGLIGTVALEVGVQAISPATGSETWIPFVIASAEREAFMRLQLGAVTPLATLEHLGAGLSRNPVLLTPVARKGIRRA